MHNASLLKFESEKFQSSNEHIFLIQSFWRKQDTFEVNPEKQWELYIKTDLKTCLWMKLCILF